ncbi:MAG: hypothetical protein FWD01_02545 [Defluviitaleaceae bacterium]|nr:hypothetical protein [Defluviitaleaceae bacterium]
MPKITTTIDASFRQSQLQSSYKSGIQTRRNRNHISQVRNARREEAAKRDGYERQTISHTSQTISHSRQVFGHVRQTFSNIRNTPQAETAKGVSTEVRISQNYAHSLHNQNFQNHNRTRNSRQADIMRQRMQEREREMKLQEKENERISLLRERIDNIRDSADIESNLKSKMISGLEQSIKHIHLTRKNRAELAAEQEVLRQKAVLEESTTIRERPQNPQENTINKNPEDEEEARKEQQKAQVSGLTRIALAQDNLTNLLQLRASLNMQASQVQSAVESPNSNYTMAGTGGGETVISEQSGYGNPSDFRNQELGKLKEGIAKTDAAIKFAISKMYRQNQEMQESRLAEQRQQTGKTDKTDDAVKKQHEQHQEQEQDKQAEHI